MRDQSLGEATRKNFNRCSAISAFTEVSGSRFIDFNAVIGKPVIQSLQFSRNSICSICINSSWYCLSRFNQKLAGIPRTYSSFTAVSFVMGAFPLMSSLSFGIDLPKRSANSACDIPMKSIFSCIDAPGALKSDFFSSSVFIAWLINEDLLQILSL